MQMQSVMKRHKHVFCFSLYFSSNRCQLGWVISHHSNIALQTFRPILCLCVQICRMNELKSKNNKLHKWISLLCNFPLFCIKFSRKITQIARCRFSVFCILPSPNTQLAPEHPARWRHLSTDGCSFPWTSQNSSVVSFILHLTDSTAHHAQWCRSLRNYTTVKKTSM